MKLLLDENVPHELRGLLMPAHEVFTVAYLGWKSVENGALLMRARDHGFDALITTDSKMEYEQNVAALPISIVVLRAESNAIEHLSPLIPSLMKALSTVKPQTLITIRR